MGRAPFFLYDAKLGVGWMEEPQLRDYELPRNARVKSGATWVEPEPTSIYGDRAHSGPAMLLEVVLAKDQPESDQASEEIKHDRSDAQTKEDIKRRNGPWLNRTLTVD
jgi:hypothetical protein